MSSLLFRSFLVLMPGLGLLATSNTHASVVEWESEDESKSLEVGGVVRFNQRYQSWGDDKYNSDLGDPEFDIARLDIDGKYNDFYLDSSYVFQDDDKTSIEKAYLGYNLNEESSVEAGLVYKPFSIYPYPQNGWTYHIPFFLGYGNNTAPGINLNHENEDWDIKLGYYPEMLSENLRYSPESGAYSELDNTFPSMSQYENEKKNQVNARIAKKFDNEAGKQEIGLSAAYSQLENGITNDDGSYYAVGLHTNNNYDQFNVQSSIIHYEYDAKNPDGVDDDMTLMGANGLTPAYFIPSEGTVGSLNLAYTIPMKNTGKLKAVKVYNDYSYLKKSRDDWADSQMNTTGVMFIAPPFLVWLDHTYGKNANIIGGATNSTGFTSASSENSNKWLSRVNLNVGINF
ncbi:hypothetical protein [Psychrobacter celer]|uniref:hypothetical protein n=1 Tax=Psychrobacter celer TaxID=306572 RepID=UPI003B8A5C3B